MKTNPATRTLVKIRFFLLCASLAAIVGLEFYFGAAFAARIGPTTVIQSDSPAAPNMNLGEVMSAVR
jgi:hypothetical protein